MGICQKWIKLETNLVQTVFSFTNINTLHQNTTTNLIIVYVPYELFIDKISIQNNYSQHSLNTNPNEPLSPNIFQVYKKVEFGKDDFKYFNDFNIVILVQLTKTKYNDTRIIFLCILYIFNFTSMIYSMKK